MFALYHLYTGLFTLFDACFCLYFISNQTCTMRIIHIIVWLCQGDKTRPTLSAFNGSIEQTGAGSEGIGAQPDQVVRCWHYHKNLSSLCVDNTRILWEEDNGVPQRGDWYNGIIRVMPYLHHDNWRIRLFQLHYHISYWSSKSYLWPTAVGSNLTFSLYLPWSPNTTPHVHSTPFNTFEMSLHLPPTTP